MLLRDVLTVEPQHHSLPPCDLSKATKQEISKYFLNSYGLNEGLFVSLADESVFYKYPDKLRLPLIFYYGHTAAVYVNKLKLSGLLRKRINIHYESLFETGVDEMSWDDLANYRMGGTYEWPSLKEVQAYRQNVKDAILQVIEETELVLPVTFDSLWWSLFMGMEHERFHFETTSVLIRQLPISMVMRPQGWRYGPQETDSKKLVHNGLLPMPTTEVTIGKPYGFPSYGWDNEYGSWNVTVPAFEACKFKVTNGEFLRFVIDSGYDRRELWTTEGWQWRTFRQSRHPTFWVCSHGCKSGCGDDLAAYSHCSISRTDDFRRGEAHPVHRNGDDSPSLASGSSNSSPNSCSTAEEFRLRLMFDVVDLPLNWPVEVNYHEAKAYCNWLGEGYRLPAEAEHHVMRGSSPPAAADTSADFKILSNANFLYGSSTPVDMFPPTSAGFYDVFGNVWEWCEDQFNGLPGGLTSYLYDDYSTSSYDGQHNMMLGGAWVSTGDIASRFTRNTFRRHFIQHCGFRVVRSLAAGANCSKEYSIPARLVSTEAFAVSSRSMVNSISLPPGGVPIWVKSANVQFEMDTEAAVIFCVQQDYEAEAAMNLSIQVARITDEVKSLCCNDNPNAQQKRLHYSCSVLQIGIGVGRTAMELVKLGFSKIVGIETSSRLVDEAMRRLESCKGAEKVIFKQFTWIPNEVGHFDIVLFSSVDRMSNVKAWTSRLDEVVTTGGMVVLVSADSKYSTQGLQLIMPARFTLQDERDLSWSRGVGDLVHSAKLTVWRSMPV